MASTSTLSSACCVCKTSSISAGVLNGPREVESNKKVVEFPSRYCHSPTLSLNTLSFAWKSWFSSVKKARKHIQSAQHALDPQRQSVGLPLAQFEVKSTYSRTPSLPATTPLGETSETVPGTPILVDEPILENEDSHQRPAPDTPGPPLKKPRRRLLPQLSHANQIKSKSCCSGNMVAIKILLCVYR